MIPKSLEVVTVLDFEDAGHHYLQCWKGQFKLSECEIISLHGILGISQCRQGQYKAHPDEPENQLSLNLDGKTDIFYKFYKCIRAEE